jgi:hypothetical protein
MAQPNAKAMRQMVQKGQAMPAPGQGRPGRFNIATRADLDNAIRAVGRVRPDTDEARAKVRRFIIQRAKAIGASDAIPDTWAADGSLKS